MRHQPGVGPNPDWYPEAVMQHEQGTHPISIDSEAEGQASAEITSGISPSLVEKFVIRLPAGLRDQIRQLSEQNRRSMNSEIIMVLENHIRQQLLDQMAETHAGNFVPGTRKKEEALKTMLEKLPSEKQDALLELLRG